LLCLYYNKIIFQFILCISLINAAVLQSKNSRINELEQKQWQEASLQDGPDPEELVAAHELNGRLQLQIIDLVSLLCTFGSILFTLWKL